LSPTSATPNEAVPAKRKRERQRGGTRRASPRSRNRRTPDGKAKASARPVDPQQRRVRNRTILAMLVLALVNAYVFVLEEDSVFGGLGSLEANAMTKKAGPLPPIAGPPDRACGGDEARIFEGLEQLIHLETSLGGGTTLRLSLLELGVPGSEIDRLEANVRSKVDLGLLGASGAPLRIAVDREGGVHAFEIELAEGRVLQGCRDEAGFTIRNLQHPLRSDVEVIAIDLGSDADLASAVLAAGEKPELAQLIADTLAAEVDFLTEARPHDQLEVMVEKRWLGRRFHRYGALLAVRFRGVVRRVAYYRYKPEGGPAGFFDADGDPMRRALLRSPVRYFPVDPDARGLLPPSVEVVEGRIGAVYRLPEGAPIVAVGEGKIRDASRTTKEGNFIDLELPDGTVVRYCHLMRFIGELERGMPVRQGQVIALAGHTGRTAHDRLRLELWAEAEDGTMGTVDPLRPTGEGDRRADRVGNPVPEAQLPAFREDTAPQRRALRLARR
jgi:murein DD-endopeptidase MepM/ murein hydrolase activator NlpD